MHAPDEMGSTTSATGAPVCRRGEPDPSAAAVALARRFLERVWGPAHDLDAIDDLMTEDYRIHSGA